MKLLQRIVFLGHPAPILTLALALSACSVAAQSQRPIQQERGANKADPTGQQRDTNESPIIIKVLPSAPNEAETKEHQEDRAREIQTANVATESNRSMVYFTRWIAILTAGLVGVGCLQWWIYRKQARLMRDALTETRNTIAMMETIANGQTADMAKVIGQSARAADANEKTAEAMAASVVKMDAVAQAQREDMNRSIAQSARAAAAMEEHARIAGTTLATTQRPFVHIDIIQIHVVGDKIWIQPRWVNSGATPANNWASHCFWKTFPAIPEGWDWPDLDDSGTPLGARRDNFRTFLGPKATLFAGTLKVPISKMEMVRSGQTRLFVYGWSEYDDAVGGASRHRTEFCNEIEVTSMVVEGGHATIAATFPKFGPYNNAT